MGEEDTDAERDEVSQGLCDAAEKGDAKEVARMLNTAAGRRCINRKDAYNWGTPLHYAVDNSNFEVIKLLVEQGADVDAMGEGGTALTLAASKGSTVSAVFLISKGASEGKAVEFAPDADKALVRGFISGLPRPPSGPPVPPAPPAAPSKKASEQGPKKKHQFLKKGARLFAGGKVSPSPSRGSSARPSPIHPGAAPAPPGAPASMAAPPALSAKVSAPKRSKLKAEGSQKGSQQDSSAAKQEADEGEPARLKDAEDEAKGEVEGDLDEGVDRKEEGQDEDEDDEDEEEDEEEEEEREEEEEEEVEEDQEKKRAEAIKDLCDAAKGGDTEALHRLLSKEGGGLQYIDEMNPQGDKPLHWAVYHSKLEAVKILVEKGADIEGTCKDEFLPGTPLSIAAWKGYAMIAEFLLSKGANKEKAVETSSEKGKALVQGFLVDLERISKLRPELETKREELNATMMRSEKPETLPTTCKGITIGGLRKMKAVIRSECESGRFKEDKSFPDGTHCKGTMKYEELTTTDVVYRYVKDEAVTQDRRFSDTGALSSEFFTAPSLFVSHAWKGRFSKLADEVLAYAQKYGLSDDYAIWMDMWAVNQHSSNKFSHKQNHDDVLAFQEVLQTCLDGTLVVCDFEMCETQSRAWCLFEWDWTMYYHGREKLKFVGLTRGQALKGRNKINVNKAECFKPDDKKMILREIVKKHSSAEVFNMKLKENWDDVYRGV